MPTFIWVLIATTVSNGALHKEYVHTFASFDSCAAQSQMLQPYGDHRTIWFCQRDILNK